MTKSGESLVLAQLLPQVEEPPALGSEVLQWEDMQNEWCSLGICTLVVGRMGERKFKEAHFTRLFDENGTFGRSSIASDGL